MKIDHIGYAVKRMDRALDSFEKIGFQFNSVIDDTDRNIKIAFGMKDGYKIELVCPLDRTMESPVDALLSKVGPTPYHICYQSKKLDDEIIQLEKQGFKMVAAPAVAIALGGRRVAFFASLGFGLMEIVEV